MLTTDIFLIMLGRVIHQDLHPTWCDYNCVVLVEMSHPSNGTGMFCAALNRWQTKEESACKERRQEQDRDVTSHARNELTKCQPLLLSNQNQDLVRRIHISASLTARFSVILLRKVLGYSHHDFSFRREHRRVEKGEKVKRSLSLTVLRTPFLTNFT